MLKWAEFLFQYIYFIFLFEKWNYLYVVFIINIIDCADELF